MGQTAVEKIVQRHTAGWDGQRPVRAGDYVKIRPKHIMTHDNTSAVMQKFKAIGAAKVKFPGQPVFALDHNVQDFSEANQSKYRAIAEFARQQGIAHFPAGAGIGHQLMLEEGFVTPGSLVVASDSHSNIYGAAAALGTPVVRTDAAAVWATGETWWQVPESVQVYLSGSLQHGVAGKDVILALCSRFHSGEVLNLCLEFCGPGVSGLSMESRMAIANMSTEWGALAGIFPYDDTTRCYFLEIAERQGKAGGPPRVTQSLVDGIDALDCTADEDAEFCKTITLNLSTVTPLVTGPDDVGIAQPASAIAAQAVRIDKAYLLSCVNGRIEDFRQAADVIRGKKVAPHVTMYIAAASAAVQAEAEKLGYWQTLLDAGAHPLPPGCGPCIGLGEGTLQAGEVGISATNRNFKGRMGDRSAHAYLSNPAVVTASAIAGHITGVHTHAEQSLEAAIAIHETTRTVNDPVALVAGIPVHYTGRLLFLRRDNMNTDGIYGKDVTYRDDLTPEQMARAAFRNYDPAFQEIIRAGDILLGGYNFGCGSSREQAATALKHLRIQLVIAGSFSQTYKRNAYNNGLMCVECPELLEAVRTQQTNNEALSIATGDEVTVDIQSSCIRFQGMTFPITPVSRIPQELVAAGGLENLLVQSL